MRAAALLLAVAVAMAGGGCVSVSSEMSCDMGNPDLSKVPELPEGVTVVAEQTLGPDACGLDGSTTQLLTASSGDSAELLERVLGMVRGSEWRRVGGFEPIMTANSAKRDLSISVIAGPEQKTRFAHTTTTLTREQAVEAKAQAMAGNAPGEFDHNWLYMGERLSDELDALLAKRLPAVLFRIDTCGSDC